MRWKGVEGRLRRWARGGGPGALGTWARQSCAASRPGTGCLHRGHPGRLALACAHGFIVLKCSPTPVASPAPECPTAPAVADKAHVVQWLTCKPPFSEFLLDLLEIVLRERADAFHNMPRFTVALRNEVREKSPALPQSLPVPCRGSRPASARHRAMR